MDISVLIVIIPPVVIYLVVLTLEIISYRREKRHREFEENNKTL